MKQRYSENFLFPQGAEDFGRSLVFPQGQLRGLGTTTEQANLTYGFLFPQGETEDYGRALMFPQGQLSGLGDATTDGLKASLAYEQEQLSMIAARMAQLQASIPQQQFPNVFTVARAIQFLKDQGVYSEGMPVETIAATAHALSPDVYVTGAGSGYGSADVVAAQYQSTINEINDLNAAYQAKLADISGLQSIIDFRPQAIAMEQAAAAQVAEIRAQQAAAAAASTAPPAASVAAAAAAASTAAVTTNPATVTRTITTVATTTTPPPATNVTYVLDFYSNQFWLKRSDGVAIANGSADWKSAALFIAPYNLAIANVSVTTAAAAKFASNSGTTTGATATSTGVTATSGGTATGVTTTTTTNQTTGTTAVTNTATGVTATTSPVTGTTTVSTSSDTGKLALYALLGVLLLRGAVR
jgi:hypothetical protein